MVLSKRSFILHNFHRDAWRNLWLSGDTGTLTVNKMALPIEVSVEMVSYSYFYWKKYDCNWVTKLRCRYYCNMSRIRPRLMSCHWSFDLRWVSGAVAIMMTSSNGNIFRVTSICAGNSPVTGEFPAQRPVKAQLSNRFENLHSAQQKIQIDLTTG